MCLFLELLADSNHEVNQSRQTYEDTNHGVGTL